MSLRILKENEEGYGIIINEYSGSISTELNKRLKEGHEIQEANAPMYYYATLQKYGIENRNGRIYPENILRREIEKYMAIIRKNASFHELDHPSESIISLKGGSPYRIIDIFWEGNASIGKLELLISPAYRRSGIICCDGDMLAHYLSYGMTIGISSRGVGSLKKINGKNIVQDDYELICFDAVSSPSTTGSYIYKNPEDFSKYDEADINDAPDIAQSNNQDRRQDEFLSKLTSFLKK